MKTTSVSTFAISSALRLPMLKTQNELVSAQKEATTGRVADVGLVLGSRTGQTVSLRQEHASLTTITATNALSISRLEATQTVLSQVRSTADDLLGALISFRDRGGAAGAIQQQATQSLDALLGSLNSGFDGRFLFGGINSDTAPLTNYSASPISANKQAVDDAFLASFGMNQSDPAVSTITPSQMQTFLANQFSALFEEPNWSATWSSASSENMQSRISPSEIVGSSVSANESAVRKLAMAYTMIADLGVDKLDPQTLGAVTEAAARLVGEGVQEINGIQARVGTAQARIGQANERMSLQIDIISRRITSLENVDPFEAATRVTNLMTQLETSFALTARIQRLSILNYL